MDLKTNYEKIVQNYLEVFCQKQNCEFMYWIADEVGGVACFVNEYFISFNDIRYDIDNNIEKGTIFKWYDEIEYSIENKKIINYQSYCQGFKIKPNEKWTNKINDASNQKEFFVKIIKKQYGFAVEFSGGYYNTTKTYELDERDFFDQNNYMGILHDIIQYFNEFFFKA